MKRIVTIITTAIVAISATAQTYLNTLKPSSETHYTAFKTGQKVLMMGNITAANGFTLGRKGGYLVKSEKVGAAIFDIGGKYEKLTFVMGPMENGTYIGSAPSVVAVYGDGRKLLDEKIYDYSIPTGYMLDISGVKELKFDIVLGEAYVGFGAAKLYTAGQSAQVPELKATTPTKPMKLVSELKPFYTDRRITPLAPCEAAPAGEDLQLVETFVVK